MQNLQAGGETCPFSFNFDATSFKVGDLVSYRVPDRFDDLPFVGTLVEVSSDHVMISPNDPMQPGKQMRGTRESRPVVLSSEVI
jgi:hypothetical protein